jgi:hypothetical protein
MGFGAHIGFLPDRGVGVIVLSNAQNQGFPDAAAQWFYDRLLGNDPVDNVALALAAARARDGADQEKAAPPVEPPPHVLKELAGTYASPLLGDATVSAGGRKLRLTLEDTEAVLTLTIRDDDLFDAHLDPAGAYAPIVAMMGDEVVTQVRFERGANGAVKTMNWISPTLPQVFERRQ